MATTPTYYINAGDKPGGVYPFRLLLLIIAGIILLAMVSCRAQYTPTLPEQNTHNRDSVRIEYRHDSIYTDRWHTQYVKGDTVYIHDSIWRDRFQKIHDTTRIHHTDTIYQPVEVPVVQEVDRSPFLRNSGIALWLIVALFVISVILGIIIRVSHR